MFLKTRATYNPNYKNCVQPHALELVDYYLVIILPGLLDRTFWMMMEIVYKEAIKYGGY